MAIKLRIEKIFPIQGRGQYLLVSPTIPGQDLNISEKSFLGNVQLDKYLDIPREVNGNGEPITDLFALKIKNDHEIFRFKENTIVELIPGNMPCLPPWHFVDIGLTAQLEREINRNHILYGKDVKTISRRQDNDDVLFGVFDADFKYAKVHLTWSQTRLTDSDFPTTETYVDWSDVYEKLFIPDNKDWK